jgi:ABC-type sugar transport system substrate-binding protein
MSNTQNCLVPRCRKLSLTLLSAAFAALVGAPAAAQSVESHYTSTAQKACKTVDKAKEGDGDWVVLSCPGRAGLVISMTEDDLRTTVSAGRNVKAAEKEPAASQGFGPFNSVGDTLEWRAVKGKAPFALIHRWFLADSQNPKPDGRPPSFGLMVVTRLPPGPVCHVAYVDVRANADPNAVARQAADEFARKFRCGTDTIHIVGKRGRALELAGQK